MKPTIPLYFTLALLPIIPSTHGQGKAPVPMQMPAGGYEFSNTSTSTTIPFKFTDNHIVIQVELNGKLLNLILDSGMPMEGALLLGSTKVDSTNLNFSAKMPVGGVGGGTIVADLSRGATLEIPNLKMTNQMILVMPHDPARDLLFWGRDGIIGFSFFANFVVEIDYETQQITLTTPRAFTQSGKRERIPVEVRGNRIFVKAHVQLEHGSSVPVELVVDTGNRAALVLNTGNRKELELPSQFISYDSYSLSRKLNRKLGRIRSFTVGHYTLANVLSSFNDGEVETPPPWEKEGNLGSEILRRFHVTFDLSNNCLFLNPNKMLSESFEYDMAGIQLGRTEDTRFIVTRVISDSPSEKAGIKTGDRLFEINNRSASQWTKDELESCLRVVGKNVTFRIERNGKLIDVTLTLARLI